MDLTSIPLFASPGPLELAVVLLIAVLLFGASKIPKLARSTGQAMGEFQRGRQEIEEELEDMKESTSLDDDGTPTAADTASNREAATETGTGTESDSESTSNSN